MLPLDPDRAKAVISAALDNAVAAGDRNTMAANVARDRKAKWAIVANADCCTWCMMVSGHGYYYNSEQSARAQTFHDYCKCEFVVRWDDSGSLEGYDPDGINKRIAMCAKTLSVGFPDTHDRHNAVTAAVLGEMETRDPRWLLDGRPIAPTFLDGANPDEYERAVAESLGRMGLGVVFRPEAKDCSTREADTLIRGVKWEFKNPAGANDLTIFNQIKKNLYNRRGELSMQASHLVISNERNGMTMDAMENGLHHVLAKDEGYILEDIDKMDEIILLDTENDRMKRFKQ